MTARKRKNLPDSAFGQPHLRKYPMPDPKHAAAAKGRALQQLERGTLSRSEYNQIVHRANQVIARCHGPLGFTSRRDEEWLAANAHWLFPFATGMLGLMVGVMLGKRAAPVTT